VGDALAAPDDVSDLDFEGFRLSPRQRRLTGPDGAPILLKPKVFDLLVALAQRPGHVVAKADLMDVVWPGVVVEENNLNQAISALRKALGEDAGKRLVVTVPGRGYQLAANVVAPAAPSTHRPTGAQPAPTAPAPAPTDPVLAVLPFDNLTGDPALGFFSDGISDEILQTVSRGLKTIGRGSSFQFRGADKSVRKVASELGATHVLDGSVRRDRGRVRIAAQLMEAAGQTTVWQSQYDRPATDLFAVQDEIAVAVAAALKCRLSPPPPTGEIDPETYELFLRVRNAGLDMSMPVRSQIDLLDQVTSRAPLFGLGWLEAAQVRAALRRNQQLEKPEADRMLKEYREALARATQLLGAEHPVLAAVSVNWRPWCGAWTDCETRLRRALAEAPHVIPLMTTLGSLLAHAGRMSEALEYVKAIYEREPLQAIHAMWYAARLLSSGRGDEASTLYENICRRWPSVAICWRLLVTNAAYSGRWDVVEQWTTPDHVARVAHNRKEVEYAFDTIRMLRDPGDPGRAALLHEVRDRLARTGRVRLEDIAYASRFCDVDALYGLIDQASFAHLADASQGHDVDDGAYQMLFASFGVRLRDDPRFVTLCARLGLVTHWIETGRWPDCAAHTPYDFRAEAHRAAATPLG
jgi:TolB-like protein